MTERPPYVRFESRAVEDRSNPDTTVKAFRDVDYALVTPMGSKDVAEKVVADWFQHLREQVQQGRFKAEWLMAFEGAYKAWKNDQEPPVDGLRLRDWPGITPAQIKTLTELRFRSVEDLAAANEETIHRLGMGGRALVQKAQDWLKASKDMAPTLEELSRLRVANEDQARQLSEALAAIGQLQAQVDILKGAAGSAKQTKL